MDWLHVLLLLVTTIGGVCAIRNLYTASDTAQHISIFHDKLERTDDLVAAEKRIGQLNLDLAAADKQSEDLRNKVGSKTGALTKANAEIKSLNNTVKSQGELIATLRTKAESIASVMFIEIFKTNRGYWKFRMKHDLGGKETVVMFSPGRYADHQSVESLLKPFADADVGIYVLDEIEEEEDSHDE